MYEVITQLEVPVPTFLLKLTQIGATYNSNVQDAKPSPCDTSMHEEPSKSVEC